MSDFLHIPIDLSCKLFDSLIRPIILYNSEIWFMEDYFSIYKAVKRARLHGRNCDKLSLSDKFCFEKVHNKFCKSVLGIKKTACNIAAKSELGRMPLDSFIKVQVMLYFSRIHTNEINPLVKEALNLNKSLYNEGIYTWYTFVEEIFSEVELDKNNFTEFDKSFTNVKHRIKNIFKKAVQEKYEKMTLDKLSNIDDSSKLFLYSKLKTELKLEEYLKSIRNFKSRQLLTKFRVSDHLLEIELGRYKNIPREQRLCRKCKVLDDESHFFFHCQINSKLREHFVKNIKNYHPEFNEFSQISKLNIILNPEKEFLSNVVDYIKQSLDMRK